MASKYTASLKNTNPAGVLALWEADSLKLLSHIMLHIDGTNLLMILHLPELYSLSTSSLKLSLFYVPLMKWFLCCTFASSFV